MDQCLWQSACRFQEKSDRTVFVSGPLGGTCPSTITESTSQAIVDGNSVACAPGASTTHYWRAFDMNTFTGGQEYDVTSVSFGIELAQSATGTGQSVTVNLYTNSGSPFPDGPTKVATSGLLNIPDQADAIFNLPIATSVPAGTLELVMEVVAPDGDPTNNVFFIGSNPDPETRTSYISAADCGTPDPVPVADIGFPDMHYVFNVNGSCPSGVTNANANRNSHRDAKAHSVAEAPPDTGSASRVAYGDSSPSATATATASPSATVSPTPTARARPPR